MKLLMCVRRRVDEKKLTFLPTSDGSLPETRQLGARDIPTTKNRISRWTKRSPSLPYLKVAFFSFLSSLLFFPPHRHNSGHRALPLPPSHTVHCSTPASPAAAPGNSGRRAPEGGKKRKSVGSGGGGFLVGRTSGICPSKMKAKEKGIE